MTGPDYPAVREVEIGDLAKAIVIGEKLLRDGTHWANRSQRDEVEKRVVELRQEFDRRVR
jgi:hypothetical protein